MSSNPIHRPDDLPESWSGVAAGLTIFIIASLLLILGELPRPLEPQPWVKALGQLALGGFLLLPSLGFTIGWILGFPRWSYPYFLLAVLGALYFLNVSTPGLSVFGYPTFGRELWGLRAFIPLLLGGGIALLVTRSFRPLGSYFSRMRQDWTLATFALSSTLPLVILIAYDEVDRAYSLRDMVLLSILMVAMVSTYLRSRIARARAMSLSLGILLTVGYTAVSTTAYWLSQGPQNVYIPGIIIWVVILLAFYLSPLVLTRRLRTSNTPPIEL